MAFRKKVITGSGLILVALAVGMYGQVLAGDQDAVASGEPQVAWVDEQTAACEEIHAQIATLLRTAEMEKDLEKIRFMSDKLTQVFVNLKGIEDRTRTLVVAVSEGDTFTADYQFAILKIYIDRIYSIKAEVDSYLGEVDIVLGETTTNFIVGGDFTGKGFLGDEASYSSSPEQVPPEQVFEPPPVVEAPPIASPFY